MTIDNTADSETVHDSGERDSYLVIRASSLSQYADCPKRWAARNLWAEIKAAGYVLRDDSRGIGMAVGIGVHKSGQVDLEQKARTGELAPLSVIEDAGVETVREQIHLGVNFDQRVTPNANDAEQQVVRMARAYHHEVAPGIQPIIVEQRLEARVPWSTTNMVVTGQADVIAREPGAVDDLKTGARLGYHAPQIGSYALLGRTHETSDITEARITWIPRVTMKKPQPPAIVTPIDVARSETAATNVLRSIDTAINIWRNGDAERGLLPGDPAAFISNPSSMLCGPKYCRAHSCGVNGWCRDHDMTPDQE